MEAGIRGPLHFRNSLIGQSHTGLPADLLAKVTASCLLCDALLEPRASHGREGPRGLRTLRAMEGSVVYKSCCTADSSADLLMIKGGQAWLP